MIETVELDAANCFQGHEEASSRKTRSHPQLTLRITGQFIERVVTVHRLLTQREGNVSAAEMAEVIGRGERQARRIFHTVTGESFRLARIRSRITSSRKLVLNSSISIATIAAQFGYSRRAKFDQSYSRLFGIMPAEDRRQTKLTKV